jgi:hypothetical protein
MKEKIEKNHKIKIGDGETLTPFKTNRKKYKLN